MNKKEALNLMDMGLRITHKHFSDNEWISKDLGKIITENGYRHDFSEFWSYRMNKIAMVKQEFEKL